MSDTASRAFDFAGIGDEISNDIIFDYVDIFIFLYIAIIFAIVGARLEHATAFILNLRIFGFEEIWTRLRDEPVYISPATANALVRCVGSSVITSSVQKAYDGDTIVEGWTIISLMAENIIVFIDPYLRQVAGCSKELGPPSSDFPYGSWEECEDWTVAYYATWYYAFAPFILLAIVALFCCIWARCCGVYDTICRFKSELAISMVAGNALSIATRSFVRRLDTSSHIDEINDFLEVCFYVYTILIFGLLELFHRFLENHRCLKCCGRITACACVCLAIPLLMLDNLLKRIVKKFNKKKHKELNDADEL